jgi:hypothetical protein
LFVKLRCGLCTHAELLAEVRYQQPEALEHELHVFIAGVVGGRRLVFFLQQAINSGFTVCC